MAPISASRARDCAPPVVTARLTAFGGTPRALVLPLTGVDPEAVTEMHEFRSVTGSSGTADALAEQLSADRPPGPAAPVIPAGARRITISANGFNADITLGLWLTHRLTPEHVRSPSVRRAADLPVAKPAPCKV